MWFKLLLFELLLFLTHSLHCFPQDPLAGRSIFSGNLFQYLEENRKWRSRFVSVPNSYTINLYENKTAQERGLHPKVSINCAGYRALTSLEDYMELMNTSLPGEDQ
ncbi:niban-like protein 1, partial [Cynoglossus semilaevis]|uniref:niban-like protein 1 n=1 Tax=Cynoglossus semilaevis TaxID=244447 RepID=UPI000D629B09